MREPSNRRQPTKVLVTGANGFIGKQLCEYLVLTNHHVRAAVRKASGKPPGLDTIEVADIGPQTDWQKALSGVDAVVHLVSPSLQATAKSLVEYRRVNVLASENLARQAAMAGVKRLVFLSTIKVNGETTKERPFSSDVPPQPVSAYGQSKWEAECALTHVASETGLEVVIIRPPLVYGPGVRGNFLQLLRWVDSGVPMPFAWLPNSRSLVSLYNLCDLIQLSINHPAAVGGTFLVSDGDDVTLQMLASQLAKVMEKPSRVWPFPELLFRLLGKAMGKQVEIQKLCDSLQVDIAKTSSTLGWKPPFNVQSGLEKTVHWYMESRGKN